MVPLDELLKTTVISVCYEFCDRWGQIHMPEGCCCDMSASIKFFQGIDPQVKVIETFAGERLDTCYKLKRGKFHAILLR